MSHGSRLSKKSTLKIVSLDGIFYGILSIRRFPFLVRVGKVLYFQKWYFSFHCPTGKSVHNERFGQVWMVQTAVCWALHVKWPTR